MIDFPSSPTDGQVFSSGDSSWVWSASTNAWKLRATTVTGPTGPTGSTGPSGEWDDAQDVENKVASYVLLTADAGKLITVTSGSATNVTVNGSLDLALGQRIDLAQLGAGQVTVVASGTTVYSTPTLKLRAQYSAATLICIGTDTYLLVGDLAVS